MDPPKYEIKKLSFSIYNHKTTCNQFQLSFPKYPSKRRYTSTIVEAWQLLKGRPTAGNVNSSFIMLQPEVAFVEVVFMLYVPCSICFPGLLLLRLVGCSEDKFWFLFQDSNY